jgi:RHS repeat-associated protein
VRLRLQRITNARDGTFHQAYSYKDALGKFNGIFRNDLVKTNGNWALQNIDDNAYFYSNPLSSKISSILDYTGSQLGYKANSGTYAYDANGNTTYDPANKLTTLYNYLNLPSKFTKDDGSKQELVYDASGKKWQENEYLTDGSLLSKRSYLGSFEFEGNSLQKVFHSTGFIQNLAADVNSGGQSNGNIIGSNIVSTQKLINGGKSEYIADKSICLLPGFESLPVFNAEIKPQLGYLWNYILSDHLGNTRVLFADKNSDGLIKQDINPTQNEVLSISNYSPFGLELGGSQQNLNHQFDYKFNGKQENGFSEMTDFGARWLDKPLAIFQQIDPLSDLRSQIKYSGRSSMGNNPILNVDPDGREFTPFAQKWIDRYLNDISTRFNKNNSQINDLQNKLESSDLSEKQVKKTNKQISRLQLENSEFTTIRSEIDVLASSSQVYDISVSDTFSDGQTARAGAGFDFSSGNFVITMPSSNLGLLSHELKHAFQFENGEYSVGPALSGVSYSNLLYDKGDEVSGYKRGAFFGGQSYNINTLPQEYNNVAKGPFNYANVPPLSAVIGSSNQNQHLQNLANRIGHAFRVGGQTYYRKKQ